MIEQFQKEHRWLSNFAPVKIYIDGMIFNSVEHAYMAYKSDDPQWKEFCQSSVAAGEIKKKSKDIPLIEDWDKIKKRVMLRCLWRKFNTEPYKSRLLSTGDEHIQEGNWWGDKYWGVCLKTGEGRNVLGKMIMRIREEIK